MSQAPPHTPADEIIGQIGLFFRRSQALYQLIRPDEDRSLERPAYILLGMIETAGPVRLTALAVTAQLNLSTISRQVSALEGAGLIIREQDPADGRASLVRVSELGRIALERNHNRWRDELTAMLADWDEKERDEFARLFTRLNEAMAERCAEDR
ncbi:MarR family winged helix-turn-helix transcriptional regulator [Longispora albida]|uniref:MarR family winged helix-turn-helix transcriptional regulator n=1 Tax=Longispora albida TaxID=203523 RepID=UPI00035F4B98|nr:MarR family transcriptional regulator [Longispora albida]